MENAREAGHLGVGGCRVVISPCLGCPSAVLYGAAGGDGGGAEGGGDTGKDGDGDSSGCRGFAVQDGAVDATTDDPIPFSTGPVVALRNSLLGVLVEGQGCFVVGGSSYLALDGIDGALVRPGGAVDRVMVFLGRKDQVVTGEFAVQIAAVEVSVSCVGADASRMCAGAARLSYSPV